MRKKYERLAFLVILIIVAMMAIIAIQRISEERIVKTEVTYTVQRGDTLWGIADKFVDEKYDKRKWIYENGLDALLHPGERLEIQKWE